MGSNRSLRHRHGIRGLSNELHRLFCRLGKVVRRISYLTIYDHTHLDAAGVWDTIMDEELTLPAGITMEAVNILFAIHRRIWDIVDAYGSTPELFDFFHDLLAKYRLLT